MQETQSPPALALVALLTVLGRDLHQVVVVVVQGRFLDHETLTSTMRSLIQTVGWVVCWATSYLVLACKPNAEAALSMTAFEEHNDGQGEECQHQ